MFKTHWKAEIDGSMTSELDDFRLEVRDVGGMARFLVLRQADPGKMSRELLGSGSQLNERSAMIEAQKMADQIKRSRIYED